MPDPSSKKRARPEEGYRRKHDRHKFRKHTNATMHRKDLGNNLSGCLISCAPHHENQCFRDAVMLLGRHCESTAAPTAEAQAQNAPVQSVADALQNELSDLRAPEQKLFTRVDGGVAGCVFVRINRPGVRVERIVEAALREARASGSPNSRHCIRLLPVHNTCYAKVEDAAKVSVDVVREHFPPIESRDTPVTYAIAFRARLNSGAHRGEYITAIAAAIDALEPRYKVNLTKPDVTLLVEVLKTSCCIGAFGPYHDLAKMNLREAACPSKPPAGEKGKGSGEKANVNGSGVSKSTIPVEKAAGKQGDDGEKDGTTDGNGAGAVTETRNVATDSSAGVAPANGEAPTGMSDEAQGATVKEEVGTTDASATVELVQEASAGAGSVVKEAVANVAGATGASATVEPVQDASAIAGGEVKKATANEAGETAAAADAESAPEKASTDAGDGFMGFLANADAGATEVGNTASAEGE